MARRNAVFWPTDHARTRAWIGAAGRGSPRLQVAGVPGAVAYGPALAEDDKAAALLAQTETHLGVARAQWLLAYDALYGDVRSMFPGRKAFVESFFPAWTKKKVEKVDAPK